MRRIDPWFWAEMLVAAIMLGLLAALAFFSDARASGVTNMLLGAGGQYQLSTTLTAGQDVVSGTGRVGYIAGTTGSMSSSSLAGGYTVTELVDGVVSGSVDTAVIIIDGFSASPGAAWLGKVTFNSATFIGSAATYSYSSGTATWTWSTSSGWGFVDADVYPGTITYQ